MNTLEKEILSMFKFSIKQEIKHFKDCDYRYEFIYISQSLFNSLIRNRVEDLVGLKFKCDKDLKSLNFYLDE